MDAQPRSVHIVEVLLPLDRPDGTPFPPSHFAAVRAELVARCGGVTIYSRAPAEGFWDDGEATAYDRIVVVRAVDSHFDQGWWSDYTAQLRQRFVQDEIMACVIPAQRL